MGVNWNGRTFGELTAEEQRQAAREASAQLQAELEANADLISKILDFPDDDETEA